MLFALLLCVDLVVFVKECLLSLLSSATLGVVGTDCLLEICDTGGGMVLLCPVALTGCLG